MTPEHVEEAAHALVAARTGQPIAALPEAARPQSEADSYAIQEAVLRPARRAHRWLQSRHVAAGRDLLRPDLCLPGACQPG